MPLDSPYCEVNSLSGVRIPPSPPSCSQKPLISRAFLFCLSFCPPCCPPHRCVVPDVLAGILQFGPADLRIFHRSVLRSFSTAPRATTFPGGGFGIGLRLGPRTIGIGCLELTERFARMCSTGASNGGQCSNGLAQMPSKAGLEDRKRQNGQSIAHLPVHAGLATRYSPRPFLPCTRALYSCFRYNSQFATELHLLGIIRCGIDAF